jgi:hypothetical protein
MNVEQFNKLPDNKAVYMAGDCVPMKVRKLDKRFIASIFNPETIRRRVWLTREAALAAALKMANARITGLREVIVGLNKGK